MNSKTKKRAIAATFAIVLILVGVLAVVGGNTAAKAISVAEAAKGQIASKIQVSGNVVENSFSITNDVLTFSIYDPEQDPEAKTQLRVSYDGGVSATFGNDVVAICTGKLDSAGALVCTELVTKCPSKYENATDALSVARLQGYGPEVLNKPVKVVGVVADGTLRPAGDWDRFTLLDADDQSPMPVRFAGALPDGIETGSSVVLTGSINENGTFTATDVALEG